MVSAKALLRDINLRSRRPRIVFAGKTGAGKTSTINALLGRAAGPVGHFAPETKRPASWVHEHCGTEVELVDLPGLGESAKADAAFKRMYAREAKEADIVFVVVEPPRPQEAATSESVRCLLECGLPPERILFAFNKPGEIRFEAADGAVRSARVTASGPKGREDRAAVDQATRALLAGMQRQFRSARFTSKSVVAYDSDSGWNLEGLLLAALRVLPVETLPGFEKVTRPQRAVRMTRAKGVRRRQLDKAEDEFADVVAERVLDFAEAVLPLKARAAVKLARPAIKVPLKRVIRTGRKWWQWLFG